MQRVRCRVVALSCLGGVALVALGVGAVRAGAGGASATLKDGRTYRFTDNLVVQGKRRAPVAEIESPYWPPDRARVRSDQKSIELVFEHDYCSQGDTRVVVKVDQLESRLENASALRHHRKKRYATAEKGFRRAVELDPKFNLAAINLASALALQGKQKEAMRSLRSYLRREPLGAYIWIQGDPELQSLRSMQRLRRMRASRPGRARLEKNSHWEDGTAAVSAEKSLIAVRRRHRDGGSCIAAVELVILDLTSGKTLYEKPLVTVSEADDESGCDVAEPVNPIRRGRARVERRIDGVNRFFRDFGFNRAKAVEGRTVDLAGDERGYDFPGTGLLVRTDGSGDLILERAGVEITREKAGAIGLSHALYLSDQNKVVATWAAQCDHDTVWQETSLLDVR